VEYGITCSILYCDIQGIPKTTYLTIFSRELFTPFIEGVHPKVLGTPLKADPHLYIVLTPQVSNHKHCVYLGWTLSRILSSERCCLLSGHTCQLIQLAVKGPHVSDVCDAGVEELAQFSAVLETAYRLWLAEPRRGL